MKLAVLFAIVFCVGLALANDIPQKKSAHTKLAHSKHSRAQKLRHLSSKRDLSSDIELLYCIGLKLYTQGSDESDNGSGCAIDKIMQLAIDCCSDDEPAIDEPDEHPDDSGSEETSTGAPVDITEETDKKRRKLNHQKRHKGRTHHAKAARAHEKKQ